MMTIEFAGFGRPLKNVVRVAVPLRVPIAVQSLA
jgi:hypothetical protein